MLFFQRHLDPVDRLSDSLRCQGVAVT